MTSPGSVTNPVWRVGRSRSIALDAPVLMAILNVTPDSFSDGGQHDAPDAAFQHARACIEAGATVIDVGGESTRPGATRVDEAEQMQRVLPVITRLATTHPDVIISVDTTRASVADAALRAGAHIVNDVSAGLEDESMLETVARHDAGVVLMHRLRPPGDDRYSTDYEIPPQYDDDDVVATVASFLRNRAEAALAAGIDRASILVDPGLGFGKSVDDNFALIAATGRVIEASGFPVLAAASRKSFIGAATGVDRPESRAAGSVAASILQYIGGARVFRVHDVAAHREALSVVARSGILGR